VVMPDGVLPPLPRLLVLLTQLTIVQQRKAIDVKMK
jgi:hypothetical protein